MAIKIFADCASHEAIKELDASVDGWTSNPTIMHKAGITDYEGWAKDALRLTSKPFSLEVFADDLKEMERQARTISSWSENVYVKIPITTTNGNTCITLIETLLADGIKVNITAVLTTDQLISLKGASDIPTPKIVSVFAGRIADTGVDPVSKVTDSVRGLCHHGQQTEILWASPREVLNIYQAEKAGAHIITCTPDLIKKYRAMKGYNLDQLSRDTVTMFYNDGRAAGFKL